MHIYYYWGRQAIPGILVTYHLIYYFPFLHSPIVPYNSLHAWFCFWLAFDLTFLRSSSSWDIYIEVVFSLRFLSRSFDKFVSVWSHHTLRSRIGFSRCEKASCPCSKSDNDFVPFASVKSRRPSRILLFAWIWSFIWPT